MQETADAVVLAPATPATASVIWLHGLGADGHDFVPIVPELKLPPSPGIRFIFPHAPVRPVTLNMGMRMRAWYDIRTLTAEGRADEAGLRESLARDPEYLPAWQAYASAEYNLAWACGDSREHYERALTALERADAIATTRLAAMLRAVMLAETGRVEEGFAALREASALSGYAGRFTFSVLVNAPEVNQYTAHLLQDRVAAALARRS